MGKSSLDWWEKLAKETQGTKETIILKTIVWKHKEHRQKSEYLSLKTKGNKKEGLQKETQNFLLNTRTEKGGTSKAGKGFLGPNLNGLYSCIQITLCP